MIQKGIVTQIEGELVLVSALSEKGEQGSCSSGGCGSGCSCNVSGQVFRARNGKALPLQPGDRVNVESAAGAATWGLLLVFGLPILLGYGFWRLLPILLNRGASSWMAISGVVAGIALSLLLGRKNSSLPEVSSI